MKRLLVRGIIFSLSLGFITTVAVAWFFAAFVRPRISNTYEYALPRRSDALMLCWTPIEYPGSSTYSIVFYFEPSLALGTPDPPGFPEWASEYIEQDIHLWAKQRTTRPFLLRSAGWPAEAMWCASEIQSGKSGVLSGGIRLAADEPGLVTSRALPLYIIPSGFTIDTALYTALWYALLIGLPLAYRKWRIYKDRCPTCGYDLRGILENGVCPECGSKQVVVTVAVMDSAEV